MMIVKRLTRVWSLGILQQSRPITSSDNVLAPNKSLSLGEVAGLMRESRRAAEDLEVITMICSGNPCRFMLAVMYYM